MKVGGSIYLLYLAFRIAGARGPAKAELASPLLVPGGTLVAWKKKKGDQVSAGEVLAEIETDKATMEWESPEDGEADRRAAPAELVLERDDQCASTRDRVAKADQQSAVMRRTESLYT